MLPAGKFHIGGLTMAGGYTNLDKVRPGPGYRRFVDDVPPLGPIGTHQEQYQELDSDEEEEAPPSYQRGGGPVFYPGPPGLSRVRSPPPVLTPNPSTPTKVSGKGKNNPGNFLELSL